MFDSVESSVFENSLLGNVVEGAFGSSEMLSSELGQHSPPESMPIKGHIEQDSLFSSVNSIDLTTAAGSFVVGSNGQVEIDFLFDGGAHAGELAFFDLTGMDGLSREAFIQTAYQRALSQSEQGRVVISDFSEGAQFSGRLGERNHNQGSAASTQTLTLAAGSRFAFMLLPNGAWTDVVNGRSTDTPLFSIAALNPGGKTQIAQAAGGVFAMEDVLLDESDRDFNDLIFRVAGASSEVPELNQVVAPRRAWLTEPTANNFLREVGGHSVNNTISPNSQTGSSTEPTTDPFTDPTTNQNEDPTTDSSPPSAPPFAEPNPTPPFMASISEEVSKFTASTSEADIIKSGAEHITIGTQTIYIGTDQVSSVNQNPVVKSFDSADASKNWTNTTLETTGTDGRGLGLIWTGSSLYGIFSVDGTQGTPEEDFRRATQDAKQNWLKSFGSGEGKIAVIAQLEPITGVLLKAAHLSAVKQDGKTNSLFVTGVTMNQSGNLVISAQSYYSPRRPDGSRMIQDAGNTETSPFDYTIEISSDLTEVISTTAPGWQ